MSVNSEKGPKRAPNFSQADKEIARALFKKWKDIIECKKTDAVSLKDKADGWEKLSKEFNAVASTPRTTKQLATHWDSLKKTARKAKGSQMMELRKTGGGEPDIEKVTLSQETEEILSIITVSGEGLKNPFDADAELLLSDDKNDSGNSNISHIKVEVEDEQDSKAEEIKWDKVTPRMLYYKKPEELKVVVKEEEKPSSAEPISAESELKRKTVEEELEWAQAAKRRRPALKEKNENESKLLAAKTDLAVMAKNELEEEARRKKELFELEKREQQRKEELFELEKDKRAMENRMLQLQLMKLEKEMGEQ